MRQDRVLYNFIPVCPKQGIAARLVSLNMAYSQYFNSNPGGGGMECLKPVFPHFRVKSDYFLICPKQWPKMEGVVLNRAGI